MSDLSSKIMDCLSDGYHCSQTMVQLSLELREIENPFLIRAVAALGGGMFARRTCGTLTGAVCAISSYFPREEGQPEPTGYREIAKELVEWFQDEFGSIECGELVEHDQAAIMQFCPGLMEKTFQKMFELLESHGIDPYE